jgi:coenzyme F420 biosynthesis associated uncharacterized protein
LAGGALCVRRTYDQAMARATSSKRMLAGIAVGGAAAIAMRLAERRFGGSEDGRLVDWDEVRRIAHARTGESGKTPVDPDGSLGRQADEMAAEMGGYLRQVWGDTALPFPPFTMLDRRGFVDRNIEIAADLMRPVERLRAQVRETAATAMGRAMVSRYLGEMFGFMSSRVLGQYDPVLMLAPAAGESRSTALYLVHSNVSAFQKRSGVSDENLRRWLVLHEVTHAWQFESHPWLRGYITELMEELLMQEVSRLAAGGSIPLGETLRRLPGALRTQMKGAARIQAVMSICEGYSNFVMHRVGREHIEGFDELEKAFHQRSNSRPALERIVLAVTGLSMKLRQYEVGEHFLDAVHKQGGMELVNRVWEGPELMPTPRELRAPQLWIDRVGAAVPAGAG